MVMLMPEDMLEEEVAVDDIPAMVDVPDMSMSIMLTMRWVRGEGEADCIEALYVSRSGRRNRQRTPYKEERASIYQRNERRENKKNGLDYEKGKATSTRHVLGWVDRIRRARVFSQAGQR